MPIKLWNKKKAYVSKESIGDASINFDIFILNVFTVLVAAILELDKGKYLDITKKTFKNELPVEN